LLVNSIKRQERYIAPTVQYWENLTDAPQTNNIDIKPIHIQQKWDVMGSLNVKMTQDVLLQHVFEML